MSRELNSWAAQLAGGYFLEGNNCCESIIRTMMDLTGTELPASAVHLGRYFRRGMGAGCVCGALVGGVMMLGLLKPNSEADLGQELHEKFVTEYGSACCRNIRRKQGLLNRVTNEKCRQITARTAEMVMEKWQGTNWEKRNETI